MSDLWCNGARDGKRNAASDGRLPGTERKRHPLCLAVLAAGALALQAQSPPPPDVSSSLSQAPSKVTSASASPEIAAALQRNPDSCWKFIPRGLLIPANSVDTLFSYRVTTHGEIRDVAVFRSSGNRDLDNAAIACANATRFPPQLVGGKFVEINAMGSVTWLSMLRPFVRFALYGTQSACKQTAGFVHPGNQSGTTIVSYYIAGDGSVKNVTVTQSSGNSHLDDSVVSCASALRFYPITSDGHPVEIKQELGVRWNREQRD